MNWMIDEANRGEDVRVIDILEAQARLEELIDELAPGEWFAISVNGVPRVKVIALTKAEIAKLTRKKVKR